MNLSAPFVRRPIGTTLLTIGIALAGIAAYFQLPVSPLPQFDLPSISVQARLPGASPENMATSVATPLEKRLGRLAAVSEMTSRSGVGQTQIQLQFDLSRDIDGAARDVMAAINASRADLPSTLRSNPSYRKFNPADQPIIILSMTSKTRTRTDIYDSAATNIQQQLSQVKGVGDVGIQGGALPAVRVELNPLALARYGIALEDVRAAISASNANRPKGVIDSGIQRYQIYTNDAGRFAKDYSGLVIAYRNGRAVRLSDVAQVVDGPEDIHNTGLVNGQNAVTVVVSRAPGANIIQTVDAVKARLPTLRAAIPQDIELQPVIDRSITIRASLADVERTLAISTILVILVVAFFLQSGGATLVPSVAVTVSLLGTIGVMFLLGFSLNNLSLMALTISTGFVVDDAIVVLENITRNVEKGMPRFQAALKGAQEVGFTVLSISVSLIAVFIPILLMTGILGRLFREFAITLSAAILISLMLSLTTTPMMCAYLIGRPKPDAKRNWFGRVSDASFNWMKDLYAKGLTWALNSGPIILTILLCTVCLTTYLYMKVPKGFFPEQDTSQMMGGLQADQSSSFQVSQQRLRRFAAILQADPAIQTVVANTGGNSSGAFFQIGLKPKNQRDPVQAVVARLRPQLSRVTGANLFLNPVQDLRIGGRQSNATYQYTLQAQNLTELRTWAAKLAEAMKKYPALEDVNTDQEDRGLQTYITIDKDKLARLGLTPGDVDNTLYDAYGQRQVTTIYNAQNQYSVVMEVAQQYAQDPTALQYIYVPRRAPPASATAFAQAAAAAALRPSTATGGVQTNTNTGAAANEAQAPPGRGASQGAAVSLTAKEPVPLSSIARWADSATPTQVNHQDTSPATTISFNLADGASLSDAQADIKAAQASIGMPLTVQGSFQGTARQFQQSLGDELYLILAAILAVYIVLGILYESYIHPLTVLSTLPSAGLGAVMALFLFHTEFSLIALIGVILLIGIVKKNAIMMIDFALEAERSRGLSSREAIYDAAMTRFRPIMMTTFAALLGAIPLAIGWGEGSEMRRPLGITIIGGLLVSQILTLLTTPVVYMYLDRFRRRRPNETYLARASGPTPDPSPAE
ncbi:MAG: efflux RND transporter permease subunit [Caulobacteraceae bacterium]